MKHLSALLCGTALCCLLSCLMILLIPLQSDIRASVPQQDVSSPVLFSIRAQQIDRIYFRKENAGFSLINLGDGFILDGYETLPLRTDTLESLLYLLEHFPLSSYTIEENSFAADFQVEIQSTLGNTILSIAKTDDGIFLHDGNSSFLYSEIQLDPLLSQAEDFIDLAIFPAPIVYDVSFQLSGNMHPNNLLLYKEERTLQYWQATQACLQDLRAQEVVVLSPTAEDLDFFGLSVPFCTLDVISDSKIYSLHCSRPQPDGTVYLNLEDNPVMYSIPFSSLPFLSYSQEIILEENIFSSDYDDTTILHIEVENLSRTFTKWNGAVLCHGKPIDERTFHHLYQLCTELIPQQAYVLPAENEHLLLRLSLSCTNPQKPADIISFYSYNEDFYSLSINGEKRFLVDRSLPENILAFSTEIS